MLRRLHTALLLPFYRRVVCPLWNGIRHVLTAAVAGWLKQFYKGPVKALSTLLLCIGITAALGAVGIALSMRWMRPLTSISVPDFEVPAGSPVSGKTLARLLSEELSQINETNQRGDPFASKLTHRADTEALQTEGLAIPSLGGVSVWGSLL